MMILQFKGLNCRGRRTLALGLLLAILLASFGPPTFIAQTSSSSTLENEHFILYEGPDGETICRAATAAERLELEKINPRNLRPINHLDGLKETDPSAASHGGTHLKIILEGTTNLNDPNNADAVAAKAAFIRAAAVWENLISSPVTIYIDADYGDTNFGEPWGANPPLGSTRAADSLVINYPTVRNNLKNRANNAAELAIYNALPVDTVPTDIGTANSVVVSAAVARATGFLSPTAQSSDSRPRIAFNSSFQFDFDRSDGIASRDFEAVATHEIGHALGFVSRNGFSNTPPGVWDLYRFRTGITSDAFATAQRILTTGGPTQNSQFYFVPGISPLALSDGGPNRLSTNNADGNQSSHWKHQFLNAGDVYIGIMDPQLPFGTQRDITGNDILAIDLFGYSLNTSTPPPPPANDNFASAQTITGCSGSINGTNISATSESNEPNHAPDDGGGTHSVWYQWQAPTGTNVTFATAGSTFDTVLAVYTGTSVGSLSAVGKADDNSSTDKTSTVSFTPSAGTTYRIAVDGYNNFDAGGEFGSVTLNWTVSNCTPSSTPQLQLLVTEGTPGQSAAVDAVLRLTDPFPVINSANLINPQSDRNTRVVVFVGGLSLGGQPSSAVMANLVDSNSQSQNIAAEDVRQVPGVDFSQVTLRLPTGLAPGTYNLKIVFGAVFSNTATIRIV